MTRLAAALCWVAVLTFSIPAGEARAEEPDATADCGKPRGSLQEFESLSLFLFRGGPDGGNETVDKKLSRIRTTVKSLFSCYPEKPLQPIDLKADAAKSGDSRVVFEHWLVQAAGAWDQDKEGFLKKVSPEARPTIGQTFMEVRRLLLAYDQLTIALSRRQSVQDLCASAFKVGAQLKLPDAKVRNYAADYRSLYYPLFPEAKTIPRERFALIDADCRAQPMFAPSGFDAKSPIDGIFADAAMTALPASLAVNFDGLRSRPPVDMGRQEAVVTLPNGQKAYSTITPKTRLPDGQWITSDQRHWTRDELLGTERYWAGLAARKSENGLEGFSRFGNEAMGDYFALCAHLLDDPGPKDKEALVYFYDLSNLKPDAWRKLPAKAYLGAVNSMTHIFVQYADAWDDVKKNPTTTQILKFGTSTELLAVNLYASGKMVGATARLGGAAVKRIIAARLKATPNATMAQIEADLEEAMARQRAGETGAARAPSAPQISKPATVVERGLAQKLERLRQPDGRPLVFTDEQLKLMNSEAVESRTLGDAKAGGAEGDRRFIENFDRASRRVNQMVAKGDAISMERIIELHKSLLAGTAKESSGGVFLHEYTRPVMEKIVRAYLSNEGKLAPADLATRFFKDILDLHAFPDGNGRTSQLLLRWILQRNGLPPPIGGLPDAFTTSVGPLTQSVAQGVVRSGRLLGLPNAH